MLPDFLSQLLQNVFALLAALAVCVLVSPYLLLLFAPLVLLFSSMQRYFRSTAREVKRLEGVSRSPIFSSFGETLNGLSTIRAYGMQSTFMEHNFHAVQHNARLYLTHNMLNRWLAVRLDMVSLVVVGAVAFFSIAVRRSGRDSIAALALLYAQQFTGMLQYTVRVLVDTETSMTAAERLLHFSTIPQEAEHRRAETAPPTDWPQEGVIRFRNVRLRYRPELPRVLRGVSFDVPARHKVGICGRTGAGKSSLSVALFRIVELDSGSIEIDGVNIAELGLGDLRERMAIIPQDPVLFSGTVRYNLDPFNRVSDAELWQALARVHLDQTVREMPAGLDTAVAEYGENLSQGQRQLVCIARAMLRHARVLVLDEATASVDGQTDRLIQTAIRENFADCTVLTIAHRLDTILDCDRVLVLDRGRVAEYDRPSVLLARKGGVFRDMVEQASRVGGGAGHA
jgi:ATP-binding cassette subfamily C (CFTR/MRP) protein 1